MKLSRLNFSILILMSLSFISYASATTKPLMIGIGMSQCERFNTATDQVALKDISFQERMTASMDLIAYKSWLVGYLSASSNYLDLNLNNSKDLKKVESIFRSVCRKYPETSIYDVAESLVKTLSKSHP